MNPRVKEVAPVDNYLVFITFDNGEQRLFDVKPYLDKGIFSQLMDIDAFRTVKPVMGSIQWDGGQDFCPDTLYLASVPMITRDT